MLGNSIMKRSCINCHFLSKEYVEDNTGRRLNFCVSDEERKQIKSHRKNVIKEYYSTECHMGVWREGATKKDDFFEIVNSTNRGNCFFYPFQGEMLFKAAEELQKREQDRRELKRSNMYTRIGLWVASGALFLNALLSWLKVS
jgi:hypothetical protein